MRIDVAERMIFRACLPSCLQALNARGGGGASNPNPDPIPTLYTIGGTITGLNASGLIVADGGVTTDSVTSGATSFSFAKQLSSGTAYNITVQSQPSGENCTVANGSGSIGSADVPPGNL